MSPPSLETANLVPIRCLWSMSAPVPICLERWLGKTICPDTGDELHHFGWNACSTALCAYAPIRTWNDAI
jgi:56kDa selenium binding protein (SBP56)